MKNVLFFTATGMESANPLLWEGRWDECSSAKIIDTLIRKECRNQLKLCSGHKVYDASRLLPLHLSDEPVTSEQVKLWCQETSVKMVCSPAGIQRSNTLVPNVQEAPNTHRSSPAIQ